MLLREQRGPSSLPWKLAGRFWLLRIPSRRYTHRRVTRTLFIRVFQFQNENSDTIRPATLCPRTDGWQWQLPASQGEASRCSMPLDKRWAHQPESSHGTPALWRVCVKVPWRESAGRRQWAASQLHSAKPGWATVGPKPWTRQWTSHTEEGVDEEARKKGTRKKMFKKKAGKTKLGL